MFDGGEVVFVANVLAKCGGLDQADAVEHALKEVAPRGNASSSDSAS